MFNNEYLEREKRKKRKEVDVMKKKLIVIGVTGAIILTGTGAGVYAHNVANAFELKADEVSIALGDKVSENVEDYVIGGKTALAHATVDVSGVDTSTVGSYKAVASYKDRELYFVVNVEDNEVPTLTFKQDGKFQTVAGQMISLSEIVDCAKDNDGISSITLDMVNGEKKVSVYPTTDMDDMKTYDDIGTWLNDITFDCSEEGDYKYEVTLEDYSHNITGDTFYVHVAEDYAKHVSGFHDWVVEQNADIDFTKGIEKDERIASVTPGEIDLSQTGEYTLTYSITGDDNSTVIEHPVTVTVIDASTAQAKANNGESVYVSGNALKEKEVQKVASTSSNSSTKKSTNSSSATPSTSGE